MMNNTYICQSTEKNVIITLITWQNTIMYFFLKRSSVWTNCSNFALVFQICALNTSSRRFTARSPRSYWPPSLSRWFSRSTTSGHPQITKHHHHPAFCKSQLLFIPFRTESEVAFSPNHLLQKLFSLPKLTLPICVHFLDMYWAFVILSFQLIQCRQLPPVFCTMICQFSIEECWDHTNKDLSFNDANNSSYSKLPFPDLTIPWIVAIINFNYFTQYSKAQVPTRDACPSYEVILLKCFLLIF